MPLAATIISFVENHYKAFSAGRVQPCCIGIYYDFANALGSPAERSDRRPSNKIARTPRVEDSEGKNLLP